MREVVGMTVVDDVLYVVTTDGVVFAARFGDVPLEFDRIGTVPETEAAVQEA